MSEQAEMDRFLTTEAAPNYGRLCRVAGDLCRPATYSGETLDKRSKFGLLYFRLIFSVADAICQLTPECSGQHSPPHVGMSFAPLAPLVRMLIETYAWFWFYAVENVDSDEREFRYLVANRGRFANVGSWSRALLSGLKRIPYPAPETKGIIGAAAGDRNKIKDSLDSCHNDLKRNAYYTSGRLCSKCEEHFGSVGGQFAGSWATLLDRPGLDRNGISADHDYLSKWVHGLPFAAAETSSKEAAQHPMHLQLLPRCCGILTLAVNDLMGLCPTFDRALDSSVKGFIQECQHYLQFVKPQSPPSRSEPSDTTGRCSMCDLR